MNVRIVQHSIFHISTQGLDDICNKLQIVEPLYGINMPPIWQLNGYTCSEVIQKKVEKHPVEDDTLGNVIFDLLDSDARHKTNLIGLYGLSWLSIDSLIKLLFGSGVKKNNDIILLDYIDQSDGLEITASLVLNDYESVIGILNKKV